MSKNEEKNLTPETEETVEDTTFTEVSEESGEPSGSVVNLTEEQDAPSAEEQPAEDAKQSEKKKNRTPEAEKERALNQVKRRKRLKYGTLATVITVVFVAIVVMVNVICGVLDSRFNWNIDMTSSGLYEVSEDTLNYLHSLDKDIKMVVMAPETTFQENNKLKVMQETLERFKAEANGHISLEYVDMTKHPEIVNKYSEKYSGEFTMGDTVVECGELVRVVPFDDMIKTDQTVNYQTYSYEYNYTFLGEQSLLSAVMGVTDLHPVNVAVLSKFNGNTVYHSEYEMYNFQTLTGLLEKNNYQFDELDIPTDAIDTGKHDMAILMAPYNDFTETQIEKLNDFLYNDGKYEKELIYFASLFQQELPNLDAFLDTWGIEVGNSYLIEGDKNAGQQVVTLLQAASQVPVGQIQESDYTAKLSNTKLPIVVPFCRPIIQKFENNSGRTTTPLLTTLESAFEYPMNPTEEEANAFDENTAPHGKYNLAVMATQNFLVDNQQHTSKLLAFGSSWMLDAAVTQSNAYNNTNYVVTLLNALAGKEASITVAEKSLNQTQISITAAKAGAIKAVTVFAIPALVALIGIVVFVRRKNK